MLEEGLKKSMLNRHHWVTTILGLLFAVISCSGKNPADIRMINGRLSPCPDTPNCVCSEDEGRSSFIEPIAFNDAAEISWERAKAVIQQMGGSLKTSEDGYLRATFTTKVFRFVDDLELRMDDKKKVFHVRSASRVGHSDLGVNRRRIERLRAAFNLEQKSTNRKEKEP